MQGSLARPRQSLLHICVASLFALLQIVSAAQTGALRAGDDALLQVERVGVPFPSWSSPVNGRNRSSTIENPHLTRNALLAPRFHRMLRYGQGLDAKTQTALFLAGRSADEEDWGTPGASMISALNPRDGGVVWRSLRNETDPVHSMHLSSDVLVTISGIDQTRVTLIHALTGSFIWSVPMRMTNEAAYTGLVDAALIPSPVVSGRDPTTATVAALAPDVIAMDRSGAIQRFAGINGAVLWSSNSISKKTEDEKQIIPLKLHSDKRHTIVVSFVKSSKSSLFSASDKYSLRVSVYQATTGALLTTFDVPGADVEMTTVFAEYDTTSNVLIIGRDAESTDESRDPHLVWLQTDGTIKSFAIPLPVEKVDKALEQSAIRTVKPKQSSRFHALADVAKLRNRGIIVARTNNGRAEVLRIGKKEKHLISFWEMEEEAWDSVFHGGVDRQNRPYLNRVFFGRAQHLINFHTMWLDVYDEQGQVTGASFQWDHDLNGDVLAAPFEVSPVSEYQLIWRSAFVTRSSSVRMLQDEKHQWIREEGLSHTTASLMIDLPESKTSSGRGSEARAILEGESYLRRVERHLLALQSLPSWTLAAVIEGLRELPNLSLESFGIAAPKRPNALSASPTPSGQPTADVNQKRGAAPLRGVGAQKLGGAGQQQGRVRPMQGVPPVMPRGSRRVPPATQDEGPPPPAHVAPREANATATDALVRDAFGFRKLIVAASKAGKLYAIDSKDGTYVWEKSLFGFGQGEGSSVPTVDVKLLALVRPIAGSGADIGSPSSQPSASLDEHGAHAKHISLGDGGLLTVVATVRDEGATFTRMWEIEALTGRFPGGKESQTGIALFPGEAKETFLLPIEDEQNGQIAAAAVSREDKLMIWPTSASIRSQFANIGASFFYAVREIASTEKGERHVLTGYTPVSVPDVRGQKVWQLPLPVGEEITSVTRAIQDPVASQGKVLGDRRTMYKYLNPHMLLVLTKDVVRRSASVYVVDSVNGKIVFQSLLAQGDLALRASNGADLDPKAVVTENWASVVFDVDVPADDPQARYKGAHRQTRLLSVELYNADSGKEETWQWRGVFSSFGARALVGEGTKANKRNNARRQSATTTTTTTTSSSPLSPSSVTVYSQLYVLPFGVRGMSATRTKLGISSKALVLATSENRLQVLPRRLLDPRRPVGRKPTSNELEEGLITYDALLHDTGKFKLGQRDVPLPRRLRVKASQLESTGVVMVDQSLDLFLTTVSPSGRFDLLSASFNKLQLLLTIVVLTAGLLITRPMVASKMLRMRW